MEERPARPAAHASGRLNEEELQSWFIKQFDSYLTAKGRRLVGWDEILEGGLAPGATVMSWRGVAGGVAAAKAGHDVVMAPTDKTYFDAYQSRLQALEPQALAKCLPLDEVYTFEPIAPALSADEGKRVLGAQASLWGEYISEPKHAEYMGFPRLLAFAETVWSTPRSRDWDSFISRLDVQFKKLDALDVNYRPNRPDPAPLRAGRRARPARAGSCASGTSAPQSRTRATIRRCLWTRQTRAGSRCNGSSSSRTAGRSRKSRERNAGPARTATRSSR